MLVLFWTNAFLHHHKRETAFPHQPKRTLGVWVTSPSLGTRKFAAAPKLVFCGTRVVKRRALVHRLFGLEAGFRQSDTDASECMCCARTGAQHIMHANVHPLHSRRIATSCQVPRRAVGRHVGPICAVPQFLRALLPVVCTGSCGST